MPNGRQPAVSFGRREDTPADSIEISRFSMEGLTHISASHSRQPFSLFTDTLAEEAITLMPHISHYTPHYCI
jgi:hypothetical protein